MRLATTRKNVKTFRRNKERNIHYKKEEGCLFRQETIGNYEKCPSRFRDVKKARVLKGV